MNYSDEILYNVTDVLCKIEERGGMVPNSFLSAELSRLQGQYAVIVVNVAMMAIKGKKAVADDARFPLSDAQYNVLVEQAKRNNSSVLSAIAKLRAAKGK